MSYCRFSSMNHMCDVYCYQAEDGFKIHVASSRLIIPPFPNLRLRYVTGPVSSWLWRMANKLHHRTFHLIPKRPIGGELDGKSFTYGCAGGCLQGLEGCRYKGYRVPQFAIDAMRQEAEAGAQSANCGSAA